MSNKEILLNYLDNNHGIITYKDCKTLDIPTIYLTRLKNEGVLNRIERGIFLSSNGDYDEYYFFQYRYPQAVFSYVSALYLQCFTILVCNYSMIII